MEELRKVPPHQIEAEQALLGGVLLDSEGLTHALEVLRGDEFYWDSHREIFKACLELYDQNAPIDLVTVADRLQEKGRLEGVGGAAYLARLAEAVPSAANVPVYARIIADKAVLRRLIEASSSIASLCYGTGKSAEEILDAAEAAVFAITEKRVRTAYFTIREVVKKNIRTIEDLAEHRTAVTGVATDFTDLDALTAGLQPSDLIIVAGRPGMGKTALALNMAHNAAVKYGVPVGVFSLEMSKEQLAMRLLCSEARVDSHKLRTGFLSRQEAAKLIQAAGVFMEAPIYIDDSPGLTTLELRAKARRMAREGKIGMLVVDYLQLMRGRAATDNREQEIAEISRTLKAVAKDLNIPVVALSQLNRKVEDRGKGDRRPQLSDLRESGAIEQDADVVMFIYRDEVYNPESPDKGVAEILIRKQRNGPTGEVKLRYFDASTRFENMAKGL